MISKFLLNKIHYIRQYPSFIRKEIFFYTRALLKKDNKKKFIVYCHTRTGSNLLCDLLDSHSKIQVARMVLSPETTKKLFFPIRYLKGYCIESKKKLCGLRIHPFYLDYQGMDSQNFLLKLYQAGWKIIDLRRRNLVRQQISVLIAKKRNQWINTLENPLEKFKIDIDGIELIKRIQEQEIHLAHDKKMLEQIPHLTITYEDDLLRTEQHQKTVDRIFEYLGIESTPVTTKYVKTTPAQLSNIIENHEEIVYMLSENKYAKFLEDD